MAWDDLRFPSNREQWRNSRSTNYNKKIRSTSKNKKDHIKRINLKRRLKYLDKKTFKNFCSILSLPEFQNWDQITEYIILNFTESKIDDAIDSAILSESIVYVSNLDNDVFDILINNLNISSHMSKDQKIIVIVRKYDIDYIEAEVEKAKEIKLNNEMREKEKLKCMIEEVNKQNRIKLRRENFKKELLRLDPKVLDLLFLEYGLTSNRISNAQKIDLLTRNFNFKDMRNKYKRIQKELKFNY